MELLDKAIDGRMFTPEKTLEVTQKYVADRIKQLYSKLDPNGWEITNNIIQSKIAELRNVQLIIGEPKEPTV